MENIIVPTVLFGSLFIGLPWLVMHYVTKWRGAKTLTPQDEDLLDGLHEMARRLDDRLGTIERIMTADNPDWRLSLSTDPKPLSLSDAGETIEDELSFEQRLARRRAE